MDLFEEQCPGDPAVLDLSLGIFLLVGTVVSFLPQHIKLYQKKTHVGLSISKVVLASMTATSGMAYYASLEYYDTFFCCHADSTALYCFANVMNFLQLILIVLCDQVILIMFVYYFDHDWLHQNGFDRIAHWIEAKRLTAVVVLYQVIVALIFGLVVGISGFGSRPSLIFGNVMLLAASLGTFLQWAPQIYRTYKLKHVGALSIPMIGLQGVGAALTSYFFYLDSNGGETFAWVPFVIGSVLITLLFLMAVYYWNKDRKRAKDGDINRPAVETAPLLA